GSGAAMGGAIFNQGGTVTLVASTLNANTARGGPTGMGGAVFNLAGTVNAANCTFSDNTVVASGTWTASREGAFGAALFNLDGTVTMTNCTVAANTVAAAVGVAGGAVGDMAAHARSGNRDRLHQHRDPDPGQLHPVWDHRRDRFAERRRARSRNGHSDHHGHGSEYRRHAGTIRAGYRERVGDRRC